MAGVRAASSLPPPTLKLPPICPDLYGKRREAARFQMLEREIALLQGDLKFVEGLLPASVYCKEVVDFVVEAAEPLTPTNKKDRKSCRAWKWLCELPCYNLPRLCCCHCSHSFQVPKCCHDNYPCCFHKSSCRADCCDLECPSSSTCFHILCTESSCHMPKCAPWVCCHYCKCINRFYSPCYSCCWL